MRSRRCSQPTRRRPGTSPSRSCDEEAAVTTYRELDDPADELLTRDELPLWQRVGGLLAVVGVLVTLTVIKLAGSAADSSGRAVPNPVPSGTLGLPIQPPVFGAAQALGVVVDGANQWVLSGSALSLMRDGEVVRTRPLAFLNLANTSTPLLTFDQSQSVIWLVVANAVPSRMIEFDSRTLRPVRTVTWQQLVHGAAAFDGYLYLANDMGGVAEVSPKSLYPRLVPGMRGALGQIAADPAEHQLIAVDASNPLAVYGYRRGELPRQAATRLPLGEGSLSVSGGNIWVGGYGADGVARLYRIDPRTLAAVAGGRAPEFNPGAVVMSGGIHVIWVRSGDPSSDLFACIDATTGRIEQRFHLSDVVGVASTQGAGVVATDQGVLPLTMGGCAG